MTLPAAWARLLRPWLPQESPFRRGHQVLPQRFQNKANLVLLRPREEEDAPCPAGPRTNCHRLLGRRPGTSNRLIFIVIVMLNQQWSCWCEDEAPGCPAAGLQGWLLWPSRDGLRPKECREERPCR